MRLPGIRMNCLQPLPDIKSMRNFGVENAALTDACFSHFSAMPKLRYLLLDGNAAIHGSSLSALQNCKLDLLTLNRTGLDDGECSGQPPSPSSPTSRSTIPQLPMMVCWPSPGTGSSRWPMSNSPRAQMEHFFHIQREKAKAHCAGRAGSGGMPRGVVRFLCRDDRMGAIWSRPDLRTRSCARLPGDLGEYVSEKARRAGRWHSYSAQGTYNGGGFWTWATHGISSASTPEREKYWL